MKNRISLLLALAIIVGLLAGCGQQNNTNKTDKLSIVTTISRSTIGSKKSSVTRLRMPK